MAALISEARRRRAAMLCPRHTSSSSPPAAPGEAPAAATGGVAAAAPEHGIWGGGEAPLPAPPGVPPPAPPPPPLWQYVIMLSPGTKKWETGPGLNKSRRSVDAQRRNCVLTERSGPTNMFLRVCDKKRDTKKLLIGKEIERVFVAVYSFQLCINYLLINFITTVILCYHNPMRH